MQIKLLRALILLAVAAAAWAAPAHAKEAKIVSEKRVGPRWIELTISTRAFTEPTKVDVDLPTGYAKHPKRRWPVTYFLAGTSNTYRSFNTVVDGIGLTKDYPSILVSPNGDSGYWSDWFNGGAFGPPMYETYVADQLIPLIDRRFRTDARRSRRAILGVSMGGYGSMMMAARHPDLFAYAASLSGAVDSNLPANGAVLSFSSTLQGAQPDAIYGPRATQEVRWHGHNPTDLAGNLRGLELQVRSANGVPNPGIGEDPASADTPSCVVEGGVYMASVDLHNTLDALGIPHLWDDYGPGCHTPPNFTRELVDTLAEFTKDFASPAPRPKKFDYASIEPSFDVYGWHVKTDPDRALEFLQMRDVSRKGFTLTGSGTTKITTPPWFHGHRRTFTVDLGPPNGDQQYTTGATTNQVTRTVTLRHP
jgi:S-formylglutathione hydrolase FrmB